MFILKLFIVIALVKFLIQTNMPFWTAGIYTVVNLLFSLAMGHSFMLCLVASVVVFIFASIYFWLLDKFEDSLLWWPIAIIGILLIALPNVAGYVSAYSSLS
ncbi:MAG: hypothetical protein ACIAQZ_14040 [Sedimentisphaeraceae bacterium JB056]